MSLDDLRDTLLEIERHVADGGWDQPGRLFALARTEELMAREPSLRGTVDGALTPIEQVPPPGLLEDSLHGLAFGEEVHGVAAVLERLMVEPSTEASGGRQGAEDTHRPQDVRIAAGVTRDGASYCAVRLRQHNDEVLEGRDLVPGLLQLLRSTLEGDPAGDPESDPDLAGRKGIENL